MKFPEELLGSLELDEISFNIELSKIIKLIFDHASSRGMLIKWELRHFLNSIIGKIAKDSGFFSRENFISIPKNESNSVMAIIKCKRCDQMAY